MKKLGILSVSKQGLGRSCRVVVVEVELEFVWEQFDFEVVVKKLMLSFTQPLNMMMLP